MHRDVLPFAAVVFRTSSRSTFLSLQCAYIHQRLDNVRLCVRLLLPLHSVVIAAHHFFLYSGDKNNSDTDSLLLTSIVNDKAIIDFTSDASDETMFLKMRRVFSVWLPWIVKRLLIDRDSLDRILPSSLRVTLLVPRRRDRSRVAITLVEAFSAVLIAIWKHQDHCDSPQSEVEEHDSFPLHMPCTIDYTSSSTTTIGKCPHTLRIATVLLGSPLVSYINRSDTFSKDLERDIFHNSTYWGLFYTTVTTSSPLSLPPPLSPSLLPLLPLPPPPLSILTSTLSTIDHSFSAAAATTPTKVGPTRNTLTHTLPVPSTIPPPSERRSCRREHTSPDSPHTAKRPRCR